LSSQATGKNKKSTASEYIKPRYQKERNMVFLLLQTSYKVKMKKRICALGLIFFFVVSAEFGIRGTDLNENFK
jgi:hypothetical protein